MRKLIKKISRAMVWMRQFCSSSSFSLIKVVVFDSQVWVTIIYRDVLLLLLHSSFSWHLLCLFRGTIKLQAMRLDGNSASVRKSGNDSMSSPLIFCIFLMPPFKVRHPRLSKFGFLTFQRCLKKLRLYW